MKTSKDTQIVPATKNILIFFMLQDVPGRFSINMLTLELSKNSQHVERYEIFKYQEYYLQILESMLKTVRPVIPIVLNTVRRKANEHSIPTIPSSSCSRDFLDIIS